MTREEAIDLLDNLIGMIEDNHNADYDEAFRMAIKALEQEPKTDGDCISRQAVLSMQYRIDDSTTLSTRDVVNVDDIKDSPPVTPKSKTGHWIEQQNMSLNNHKIMWFECSECGHKETNPSKMYRCVVCGAKMESEE